MNSKNFNDDVNSLTNRTSSNSGGSPEPFDKESGAFSDSWDWDIFVEPLQPGETATCHVPRDAGRGRQRLAQSRWQGS